VEIASRDAPGGTFTRTDPSLADTDSDGLRDDQEAHNNARVSCNAPQSSSVTLGALPALPGPLKAVPGPGFMDVANNPALRSNLVAGKLYQGPDGHVYGMDKGGLYVQGGYGIRLYLNLPAPPKPGMVPVQSYSAQAPGTNGKLTDPQLPDTDGDHLTDGLEVNTYLSNPTLCDSDGDGLGDALELGVPGTTLDPNNTCTHLDSDAGATRTDPLSSNTDNDGTSLTDGVEDANRNGIADGLPLGGQYCGLAGAETDPSDADSDDDGIMDGAEVAGTMSGKVTSPFCFDTDRDGLSDGLEQGVVNPIAATVSVRGTDTAHTVLGIGWPTWQAFLGTFNAAGPVTTPVDDPDADDDGIPDGLEDVSHDGLRNYASSIGTQELDPKNPDTDGDNMIDGRELLVYSPTQANSIGVDFPTIMQTPGFTLGKTVFQAANPWVTDPRGSDTDGDGAKDGADLNPRADALLGIRIPGFRMVDAPDSEWYGGGAEWNVELFFDDITVLLPITDTPFELQMSGAGGTGAVEFPSKTTTAVPNSLIEHASNGEKPSTPSTLGTLWKVNQLADDQRVLAFNIPETPPPSADLRNLAITVTIQAKDYDGCCEADDRIDLNSANGASAAVLQIKLGEDTVGQLNPSGVQGGYLVEQATTWEYQGKSETLSDEGGYMKVKAGDTLPSFFLQALEKVNLNGKSGLPDGNCQGQPTCVY
jgi:hypothetical protein